MSVGELNCRTRVLFEYGQVRERVGILQHAALIVAHFHAHTLDDHSECEAGDEVHECRPYPTDEEHWVTL